MNKQKIWKSLFLKNVLKVSSGTFLAQVLMLIGMPIITRLYSKEIIGIYALYVSTIGITTSFVTLAYDNTLVLPEKNEDANALFKITLLFALFFSFLIPLVFLTPIDFFDEYRPIGIFIAFGTFLQVFVNTLGYFKVRHSLYGQLSKSKVFRNFSLIISQILLYYLTDIYGLLLGNIIGSIIAIIYLINKDKFINSALLIKQKKQLLYKNLVLYKDYPKYFCWSNLILALSTGLPVLIFNEYYTLIEIAVYSIATSIIIQPAGLVSSSIRPVLLSKLAQKKNRKESIIPIFTKGFYLLLLAGITISLCIYFLLPSIVVFIFGEEWIKSAELTRLLIPIFIWYFISIPASVSLKVYPFQKYAFFYSIFTLLIKAIVLFVGGILKFKFNDLVLIFCLVTLIIALVNHLIILRKIKVLESRIRI